MSEIVYEKLTDQNFDETSLDEFVRHQVAKAIWMRRNGGWQIETPVSPITWDWNPAKRRQMAGIITSGIRCGGFGYGAFLKGRIIGYIYFSGELWGAKDSMRASSCIMSPLLTGVWESAESFSR